MKAVKIQLWTMLCLLVLGLAGPAYAMPQERAGAQERSASWKEMMQARRDQLFQDLGLSEDQKRLLEENKSRNEEQRRTLSQNLRARRADLRAELQKPDLDQAAVERIHADIKALQAQEQDFRLEGILEVRRILTPDQFRMFMEKMEERRPFGREAGNDGADEQR